MGYGASALSYTQDVHGRALTAPCSQPSGDVHAERESSQHWSHDQMIAMTRSYHDSSGGA